MVNIQDKSKCNGCGACEYICPVNAITMIEDNEGFSFPKVDKKKCINCGKCEKLCGNSNMLLSNIKCYAAYNKELDVRINSSSGAIFPLLAKFVISKGGTVVGVSFDKNMNVNYDIATTMDECKIFSGSKYVRANLNNIYAKIEGQLKNDKYVLVSGTPCFISGVKNVFSKYDKLILCDIVCHSTPSQKVYRKYLDYIENKYHDKIQYINFRDKSKNWENSKQIAHLKSGKKVSMKLYHKAFANLEVTSKCCEKCQFTSCERVSDITIADFWGVDKIIPNMNDHKGISLVMVNTVKGEEIFNNIKDNIIYSEISQEHALMYNHNKPITANKNRELIFSVIDDKDFIKYLNIYTYGPWYIRIVKKMVPQKLKLKLISLLRKNK